MIARLAPWIVGLSLIVAWEGLVYLLGIRSYLLPPPSEVFKTLLDDWYVIYLNIPPTLIEIIAGYLLSVAFGIPLAALIVYSDTAERIIYPPLLASQAIPKVAVAPLLFVWLGYGLAPKIWIAFLISFFPIVIDTVVGLRSIRPEMILLGRSMGGNELKIFLKLRLPNALPSVFGGLKVAITLAVVGAITGEFIGAEAGLGYLLTAATGVADTSLVFAVVIVITVIAALLFGLIEYVEKRSIPWHASMRSIGH